MKIQDLKNLNQERLASAKKFVDRQDNFVALAETIVKGLKNIDPGQFKEVTSALTSLSTEIKKLPSTFESLNKKDAQSIEKCMAKIVEAINSKDFSPKIDVKPPAVPKIDTSSIVAAIGDLKESDGIDLDNYRGVTIDNDSEVMQYIGFLNPKGEWYIACNNMESNQMTYVFGKANFTSAWESHMNLGYAILNVAVAEAYK